jgi:hypothetical protein
MSDIVSTFHLVSTKSGQAQEEEVLYDNMKQVKLGAGEFHPLFLDFARTEGFEIRTHRVRRPRTKGKVERSVFFVRDNFLNGREFRDVEDLNAQGLAWADRVNRLVHGTTGRIPVELLSEEKLRRVVPYRVVERTPRRAGFDGFRRVPKEQVLGTSGSRGARGDRRGFRPQHRDSSRRHDRRGA